MVGYPITMATKVEATAINQSVQQQTSAINASSLIETSNINLSTNVESTALNQSVLQQLTPINLSTNIITGQQGMQGPAGSGVDTLAVNLMNVDSVTILAGMAIAFASSGVGAVRASKVTADDRRAIGIAQTDAIVGNVFPVVVLGICDMLPLSGWTAATGSNWLPANSRLMLGVDGMMSNTPSATPGEFHQEVARVSGPWQVIVNPSSIRKLEA